MFQQNTGTYYRQIKVAKKAFTTLPIIAFRKDISLKQIIGTNTIHNNEKLVKLKIIITQESVSNSTCCLCCQQLISTTTFKSNQNNKRPLAFESSLIVIS